MSVAAIAVVLLAACGQPASDASGSAAGQPADPRLGVPNPAAGSPVQLGLFNAEGSAQVDQPGVGDAAVAAAAYANDYLGGLDGHPIEITRCADKANPAVSQECANQFLRDRVAAVVAGLPATADAIEPEIVGAGIPWVGSAPLTPSELSSPDAFFFGAGFIGTLGAWAQYARDVGYRDVAMLVSDAPLLTSAVEAVGRPSFVRAAVGMQVVTIPLNTTDANTYVQQTLAKKPDAVAVLTDTPTCEAVMVALHVQRANEPKLLTNGCVNQSVLGAVGEQVIDNAVLFNIGDPSGTHHEAQLYRAVMARYAPSVDASGSAMSGYLTMLSLVRAINTVKLRGDPTPAGITAALRSAKDIPRPVGDSGTFSCDRSALSTPIVKATICTDELMYARYTGGLPDRYGKISVGSVVNG